MGTDLFFEARKRGRNGTIWEEKLKKALFFGILNILEEQWKEGSVWF